MKKVSQSASLTYKLEFKKNAQKERSKRVAKTWGHAPASIECLDHLPASKLSGADWTSQAVSRPKA